MPAVAVADRVAALRSRNPSKGRGCCGVAVPGVESGERLAFATGRTTPAAGGDPSPASAPDFARPLAIGLDLRLGAV